jgi:hypothetical protein
MFFVKPEAQEPMVPTWPAAIPFSSGGGPRSTIGVVEG